MRLLFMHVIMILSQNIIAELIWTCNFNTEDRLGGWTELM